MKVLLYCKHSYSFGILHPLELAARRAGHIIMWYVDSEILNRFPFRANETVTGSLAEAHAWRPDAVFVPGNAVPSTLRGVKAQIFHGFAGEKKGHFRIRHYFDLYLTQGPYFTREFRRLAERYGDMQVCETGWSKLDPLFAGSMDLEPLRRKYGIAPERKVLLYAPTFSPKLTSAPALLDRLQDLTACGPNGMACQVLVKFHPLMDPAVVAAYRERAAGLLDVQVVDEDDLLPFMRLADVMLSDTSSAVYEFLLLDKPVVTLNSSAHTLSWIDVADPDSVAEACRRALAHGVDDNAVKREYHPYDDGRSSERMLAAVEDYIAQHGIPERRRIPWWRRFKLRKSQW
jgi:CDP-glycerol glycerophosphotransferase (TagB/SpsB family)